MVRLDRIIPNPEDVLELEPEELAGAVLETLQADRAQLSLGNYVGLLFQQRNEAYPQQHQHGIGRAIAEAWNWLEREGFLARDPKQPAADVRFLTRRGRKYRTAADLARYRMASALPWLSVHFRIREKVRSTFLRGDHDTAVFQAFKEVEIAVREACSFGQSEIGAPMMRKAFAFETGPLTDRQATKAEQEALSHLFAGAIGSYKNPQSHRHVGIPSAEEAAEMIILASHLLRIVEARVQARQADDLVADRLQDAP
jgi:uncharacterized protein (TIGR02391 family)